MHRLPTDAGNQIHQGRQIGARVRLTKLVANLARHDRYVSCFGSLGDGLAGAGRHTFAAKDCVVFACMPIAECSMCIQIDALDAGNIRTAQGSVTAPAAPRVQWAC